MGSFGGMSSQWQDLQNTQLPKQAFESSKTKLGILRKMVA
jgi:hypothetical protein